MTYDGSWRHTTALCLAIGAINLVPIAPAVAHGPCRCTWPDHGPPGTRLKTESRAIEIVWNPPPESLRIDPSPLISGDYVERAPSPVLFESPVARRGASVEIPDVASGRYLMVIYDGSEGGAHYTWDHIRVLQGPHIGTPRAEGEGTNRWWVVLTAGCLAIAGAWVVVRRWRASA